MGKLILGIIAVVALQIAFFSYMITRPSDITHSVSDGDPIRKMPELSRSNDRPEVVVPPLTAAVDLDESASPKSKVSVTVRRQSRDAKSHSFTPNPKRKERPDRKPIATRSNLVATRAALVRHPSDSSLPRPVRQPHRMVPKGYTMVLVDYPTSTSYTRTEGTVLKDKKRSYLARALPALVKKPWRWMKSLASKIN